MKLGCQTTLSCGLSPFVSIRTVRYKSESSYKTVKSVRRYLDRIDVRPTPIVEIKPVAFKTLRHFQLLSFSKGWLYTVPREVSQNLERALVAHWKLTTVGSSSFASVSGTLYGRRNSSTVRRRVINIIYS